jgi:hypothetical protein
MPPPVTPSQSESRQSKRRREASPSPSAPLVPKTEPSTTDTVMVPPLAPAAPGSSVSNPEVIDLSDDDSSTDDSTYKAPKEKLKAKDLKPRDPKPRDIKPKKAKVPDEKRKSRCEADLIESTGLSLSGDPLSNIMDLFSLVQISVSTAFSPFYLLLH